MRVKRLPVVLGIRLETGLMVPTRNLLLAVRTTLAVLVVMLVLRTVLFTTYLVEGTSMLDALLDGDRILVGDASWLTHPLANGDTVVVEVENDVLVKRIVAGPGDVIAMDGGVVVRNGRPVTENIPPIRNRAVTFPDYRLGPAELFLLGDNRRVSIDSRDFGPIHVDQVLGRVYLRISGYGLEPVVALERDF